MHDHQLAMLMFVRLAMLSHRKKQIIGRDKFLLLAAVAASRSGWPEVADRCRLLMLESNPKHMLHRFDSVPDALQSEDFQSLNKQVERFCSPERAELLLSELQIDPHAEVATSPGEFCLGLLDICKSS